MIISIKDLLKLFGISIVCFCAVFVCTFFLNFYMDVSGLPDIPAELEPLYNAQLSTARFTSGIAGGFLGVIAVVMLIYYIRLYISSHTAQLGTLKAMGYSSPEIAIGFWIFGLSVLVGAGLGYGFGHVIMPYVYDNLLINGLPKIAITYHPVLLVGLVIAPTVLYSFLSSLFAYFSLKKPVEELLRGKSERVKLNDKHEKERPFIVEMLLKSVTTKKSLAFFVAFGAFCFSGMVQMALSMEKLSTESMGGIILIIGLVLASVSLLMAIASLVHANAENISIMKAFGYNLRQCTLAVFGGFVPFAILGFAMGTVYQYGLLSLIVNIIYKNVDEMPEYKFDAPLMLITFTVFIVAFAVVLLFYVLRLNRISIKQVADE